MLGIVVVICLVGGLGCAWETKSPVRPVSRL